MAIIALVSIKLNPNLGLLDQVFLKPCWTERFTEIINLEVTQSFNVAATASLISGVCAQTSWQNQDVRGEVKEVILK